MAAASDANAKMYESKEDRFSGVNVDIGSDCAASASDFAAELKASLAEWKEKKKRGIWFKVPISCARFICPLVDEGFTFHHAKPSYAMLVRWLEDSPSKLPQYGFTQVGVGGCVVNSKEEVLMIQERTNADARFQGLWKLPGGLADPGEDLAVTAGREVSEETGIKTELHGVVSIRHAHNVRFGQGDLYCVVRLRALSEEITIDPEEIVDARWMSFEEIQSRVPTEKKETMAECVTSTTCAIIKEALRGSLIQGTPMPSAVGGMTMMYTAANL